MSDTGTVAVWSNCSGMIDVLGDLASLTDAISRSAAAWITASRMAGHRPGIECFNRVTTQFRVAARHDHDAFARVSALLFASHSRATSHSRSVDRHGLILTVLVDSILLAAFHIRIEHTRALTGFAAWVMVGSALAIIVRAPRTRWLRTLRDFNEGISLFALASLLGAIASYPLAASHHALADAALERSDTAFHFHWVGCYLFVAAHPWLQMPERAAYLSIFVTPAILVAYFAIAGRPDEIRRFLAAFWIAMILTLALFPFLPAIGPLATLWHGALPYMPVSGLYQDELMVALREHRISSIDLGALHGLVCAPSFHAASATIYFATAWRARRLRWPLAGLNLAMLAATPVEGTHYLTDLLAGIAIAGLALLMTHSLTKAVALTNFKEMLAGTRLSIPAE